jgi:uncharacterized small protein (DUF1192 family)
MTTKAMEDWREHNIMSDKIESYADMEEENANLKEEITRLKEALAAHLRSEEYGDDLIKDLEREVAEVRGINEVMEQEIEFLRGMCVRRRK